LVAGKVAPGRVLARAVRVMLALNLNVRGEDGTGILWRELESLRQTVVDVFSV